MLRDNSCVCRSVYYCAIKLGRFDAPSRHFQLVKKHTHTRKTKKKKKRRAHDPPPYLLHCADKLAYSYSHWIQRVLFKHDYNMLIRRCARFVGSVSTVEGFFFFVGANCGSVMKTCRSCMQSNGNPTFKHVPLHAPAICCRSTEARIICAPSGV